MNPSARRQWAVLCGSGACVSLSALAPAGLASEIAVSRIVGLNGTIRELGPVGTTIERADADAVRSATGFSIGGTPPFGHPSRIPTYIDTDLLDHAIVWAAAGAPDTVFPMAPARLIVVSDGVVADFAER